MHNFKNLNIWKIGIEYVSEIYKITHTFPANEQFGLTSQIRRAAVSIPANIAEGSAKSSSRDFSRFLEMAIGSSYELETELLIALNLGYIDGLQHAHLSLKICELQKMILGFKKMLNNKPAS
jgi:four helix bundle protein